MSQKIEFDDITQAVHYAGMSGAAGGCVAVTRKTTSEDVIYRVATVTAVLLILMTML